MEFLYVYTFRYRPYIVTGETTDETVMKAHLTSAWYAL